MRWQPHAFLDMYVCMYPCTYVCFPAVGLVVVSDMCISVYNPHIHTHTNTHVSIYLFSFPSSGDEPGETGKMRDGTRGWVPFTVSFYSSVIPASAQTPSFYLITVPLSSLHKNKWVLYGWPWLSRCLRNSRNTETKDLGLHYLRTQCMSSASIVLYLAYSRPKSAQLKQLLDKRKLQISRYS